MDKEYLILDYIEKYNQTTQREISDETGVSLGTVNVLLKKMIREGLVKVISIPASRVAYMLTPQGIQEKLKKACAYVRLHYSTIDRIKSNVGIVLKNAVPDAFKIEIMVTQEELADIVRAAAEELEIDIIGNAKNGEPNANVILIHDGRHVIDSSGETFSINILSELTELKNN